jgi:hypothetical protein
VGYQGDTEKIIEALKRICREHQFGKLICIIHPRDRRSFIDRGFLPEGAISGFFRGEDAECLSCFFDPQRERSNFLSSEDEIISHCADNDLQDDFPEISEGLRTAQKEDAEKNRGPLPGGFSLLPHANG